MYEVTMVIITAMIISTGAYQITKTKNILQLLCFPWLFASIFSIIPEDIMITLAGIIILILIVYVAVLVVKTIHSSIFVAVMWIIMFNIDTVHKWLFLYTVHQSSAMFSEYGISEGLDFAIGCTLIGFTLFHTKTYIQKRFYSHKNGFAAVVK